MQNEHARPLSEFNNEPKQALLIGATGATGRDLLDLLLKADGFQQVEIFVRRNLD